MSQPYAVRLRVQSLLLTMTPYLKNTILSFEIVRELYVRT
jgi:hypothetical protein